MHWIEQSGRDCVRRIWSTFFVIVLGLTCAAAWGGSVAGSLDKGAGLRGFNLGARSATPFANKDYADLAAYGANLVRIGVSVPISAGGETFDIAAGDWEYMDRTVAMGRKHGFKVILALVPIPLGEESVHWIRPDLKASLVEIWTRVAARFKGNPVIAGYDLINEPVTPRDRNQPSLLGQALNRAARAYGAQDTNVDEWRALATKMIQAIRAQDADSVIIFEPSPWALPKGFAQLTPLPFSKVVYSFHFYEPHALTHQGLYEYRAALDYPSQQTSRASLSNAMEPVRAFSRKYAVPIFVGEFSMVRWAPGDSASNYLKDAIELFEAEGWNWTYHAFREYEGWDGELDQSLPKCKIAPRSGNAKVIRLLIEKVRQERASFICMVVSMNSLSISSPVETNEEWTDVVDHKSWATKSMLSSRGGPSRRAAWRAGRSGHGPAASPARPSPGRALVLSTWPEQHCADCCQGHQA